MADGADQSGTLRADPHFVAAAYAEIKQIAARLMASERPNHTLQATALVGEAYLKLSGREDLDFADRRSLIAAAAEAMRQILIDHARARRAQKRGGTWQRIQLAQARLAADENPDELLALNEAFEALEANDAKAAAVVRLRFFAGLSRDETAAMLGWTLPVVDRHWKYARAWLYLALEEHEARRAAERDNGHAG